MSRTHVRYEELGELVAAHRQDSSDGRADELTEKIRHAHEMMAAAHAELLRLIAEYDDAQHWKADGAHDVGEWITWFLDVSWETGADWARSARRLSNLPALTATLAQGDLSYDQTRVLARFVTPETDAEYAENASRYSVAELVRVSRRSEPVTAQDSDDTHADRYLRYRHDTRRRTVRGNFELPEEAGETLIKGLQRQIDTQLDAARDAAEDTRMPYHVRLADALIEMAAHEVATDPDPDRATVVIQVPIYALTGPPNPPADGKEPGGWILGGPPISAETTRRLSCDCRRQSVTYDQHGVAVGIGVMQRSVPPSLTRTIRIRDVTCRWPGCTRRTRLHTHHIRHWAQGGPTNTTNCCSLCPHHHRLVHESRYQIQGNPNDQLTFKRPDGTTIDIRPPPPP